MQTGYKKVINYIKYLKNEKKRECGTFIQCSITKLLKAMTS